MLLRVRSEETAEATAEAEPGPRAVARSSKQDTPIESPFGAGYEAVWSFWHDMHEQRNGPPSATVGAEDMLTHRQIWLAMQGYTGK